MSKIQLKGRPSLVYSSSSAIDTGNSSSKEAHILNSLSFPEGDALTVVDTIDAADEDAFSLESFGYLIAAHHKAGKDFILARVLTMSQETYDAVTTESTINDNGADVHIEDRKHYQSLIYKSYYAAHQINRSLFRTQPEEGLLHRMKAKNPMNNLGIVGDVHYYVVRCPEAMNKCEADQADITLTRSSSTVLENDDASVRSVTLKASHTRQETDATLVDASHFTAEFFATDDDYLMRRHIREFFKRNCLNAEDIFLFTLAVGAGANGMVSDPTNPNAVAMTLERAIQSLNDVLETNDNGVTVNEVLRSALNEPASTSNVVSNARYSVVQTYTRLNQWFCSLRRTGSSRRPSTPRVPTIVIQQPENIVIDIPMVNSPREPQDVTQEMPVGHRSGRQRSWISRLFRGRRMSNIDTEAAVPMTPGSLNRVQADTDSRHSFRGRLIVGFREGHLMVAVMVLLFLVCVIGSAFQMSSDILQIVGWSMIGLQVLICIIGGYMRAKGIGAPAEVATPGQDTNVIIDTSASVAHV